MSRRNTLVILASGLAAALAAGLPTHGGTFPAATGEVSIGFAHPVGPFEVAPHPLPTASPQASGSIEGSYIVRLDEGADPHEVAAAHGGEVAHVYDEVVGGFAFRGSQEARDGLSSDPRVAEVDEDFEVRLAQASPPRPSLEAIEAPGAWAGGALGAGVNLAVIDSGLAAGHPDLAGNVLGVDESCVSGSGDHLKHGTAVTGVMAGRHGVLPKARVLAVKVIPNGQGTTAWSNVVCGLERVAAFHRNKAPIHALNISLVGPGTDAVRRAVSDLQALGIAVVAAGGHDRRDVSGAAPASYQGVVAVSALDTSTGQMIGLNNYGPRIDLTAPGKSVHVLNTDGTCCLLWSGTSFAAPHVTALVGYGIWSGQGAGQAAATLKGTGTCPNGSRAAGSAPWCAEQLWPGDGDSIAEPLINACRFIAARGGSIGCAGSVEEVAEAEDPPAEAGDATSESRPDSSAEQPPSGAGESSPKPDGSGPESTGSGTGTGQTGSGTGESSGSSASNTQCAASDGKSVYYYWDGQQMRCTYVRGSHTGGSNHARG